MMRNISIFAFLLLIITAFSVDGPYKDGVYIGVSRARYIDEPYYGFSKIVIESGDIIEVEFFIRDSIRHETFSEEYEKYFAGNAEYIQQCRNDWVGIKSYPDSLLRSQNLNKVDAISGATWSYDIFVASTQDALSFAEKENLK